MGREEGEAEELEEVKDGGQKGERQSIGLGGGGAW